MIATGIISYSVHVHCPHCKNRLELNEYPYTDDGEYEHGEDHLGLALFGTTKDPAKWEGINIDYTCCKCKKKFTLNSLEI